MSEISKVKRYLQEEAGNSAHLKMGITKDESLTDEISITVIATGFEVGNTLANPNHISTFQGNIQESQSVGIQNGVWPNEPTNAGFVTNAAPIPANAVPVFPVPSSAFPNNQDSMGSNHPPQESLSKEESIGNTPHSNYNEQFNNAFSGGMNSFGISPSATDINSHHSEGSSLPNHQQAMNPVNQAPVPFEPLNDLFNENPLSDIFKDSHLEKQRGNRNNVLDDYDVPAYLRKGINLQSAPPSNGQLVSKITIQEENASADRDLTVRPNRHLHDNVD